MVVYNYDDCETEEFVSLYRHALNRTKLLLCNSFSCPVHYYNVEYTLEHLKNMLTGQMNEIIIIVT